ncbi:MAG: sec-independent protein translocase protein TatA [Lentisphaeria bacterium]|jgi:sec-independent protein translocase protein TatA
MGLGGISIPSLILILVIVLLLFGTKKLRGLGGDLGGALKGFKKAMSEDEDSTKKENIEDADASEKAKEDAAPKTAKKDAKEKTESK